MIANTTVSRAFCSRSVLAIIGFSSLAIFVTAIVAILVIGTIGWATQPATVFPIRTPLENPQQPQLISQPDHRLSRPIQIATHPRDRASLQEYIHADVQRHNGYLVHYDDFAGMAEYHVPQGYVPRLQRLADDSTWSINGDYQAQINKPTNPAIAGQAADTVVQVSISRHIATRPFYVTTFIVLSIITFISFLVMVITGLGIATAQDYHQIRETGP